MKNKLAVLVKPIMTEKAYSCSSQSIVVFQVLKTAGKNLIKSVFEDTFNIKVLAVRVLNRKAKIKRFKGHLGSRANIKLAYIRIADGQDFDLVSSLGGGK